MLPLVPSPDGGDSSGLGFFQVRRGERKSGKEEGIPPFGGSLRICSSTDDSPTLTRAFPLEVVAVMVRQPVACVMASVAKALVFYTVSMTVALMLLE